MLPPRVSSSAAPWRAALLLFTLATCAPGFAPAVLAAVSPAPTVVAPTNLPSRLDATAVKPGERKPSPPLSSLPPPKASGPRRILLVDDDWDGNVPGAQPSPSDKIFRSLVAAAVNGDAKAWSTELVETNKDGPAFERLRDFNVVIWYTGGSYGGGYDSRSTLSVEDEKVVRRYLEEVGGAFILVSPGFFSMRAYATTWTDSDHPFLKEVMGVKGFASMVQRYAAGTARAFEGTAFSVESSRNPETQFTAVNADGAAVIFSATLDPRKTAEGPVPVALANPYGAGRFVYVGFTLENIAEAERTKAFSLLLEAATGAPGVAPSPAAGAGRVAVISGQVAQQRVLDVPTAPPGQPVSNLEVYQSWPGQHSLRWIAGSDTTFEVYRRDSTGWKFLRSGFRENFFDDRSYVAPGSAYKVVSVYADGRRGEAVVEYPNPPQPERPTGLKAVQTGLDTVQIDWVNVPGVGKYRVYGPGAPDGGIVVNTGTYLDAGYGGRTTMQSLPIGIHEIRVVAEYQPGPAPVSASIKVAVNSDRGRYRLTFLGLKVNTPVDDDIIDADGRGNEVYAAAYWATASPTSGPATQGGFARTLVLGDTNNFPTRVRAGSAGPTGGLRAGDVIPSPAAAFAQPGVVGQTDRFPLKLWEGELVDGGPIVAVIPIVFEWNAANHGAWDYWANYWSSPGNVLEKLGEEMRRNQTAPLEAQNLYGMYPVEDATRAADAPKELRPAIPQFVVAADRDRPIGLMHAFEPRAFVKQDYGHRTKGFPLTRRRVEAALNGQPYKVLELTWADAVSGNYTGYFQIERLSEAPLVAPPPTAGVPVVGTGTIMIPGAFGTALPGQPASTVPPATPPLATRTLPGGDETATRTVAAPPAPPPGPPPTNVSVVSEHPARHLIRWSAGQAKTVDVYRKEGEQWVTVVSNTTFAQALDESFLPPQTVYRIAARYADGRYGQTDFTFANPAQPQVVTELKMTQTGEGKVKLSWKAPGGTYNGFRVFAPGLPAAGQPATSSQSSGYEITNMPEGPQLFRVACQYGGKAAPVDAQLTATVATWSGQYRAVLLGFRVGRKTVDDDIFDGDGRGDEVFFAAYRAMVTDLAAATLTPLGTVQSVVHGDTNRFPTRVRVGNAGPTGGVRSGDVIPAEAALAPQPGIAASPDRLPFLLWEGNLRNDGGVLALGFSVFEWDNTSTSPMTAWTSWWDTPNGRSGLIEGARQGSAGSGAVRYLPFATTYEVQPDKPLTSDRLALPPPPGTPRERRYTSYLFYGAPLANRPIGVIKSVDTRQRYYVPHGLVLSRRNVEATLQGRNVAVVTASMATHRGPGITKPEEEDEAEYTVYIQIERTSPPPVTGP